MATHYITSTANTGTGTLRTLITNATNGDTIQPDPTIFPSGTVCKTTLSANLTFTSKYVNILGAQTRIEINGANTYYFRLGSSSTGYASASQTIEDVDFVNCSSTSTSTAIGPIVFYYVGTTTVRRCRAVGCTGYYAGGFKTYGSSAKGKFYDCAAYGNRCTATSGQVAFAFWFNTANSANEMYRCTYGGCVTQTSGTAGAFKSTPSKIGDYVAPTYEDEWRTPPASTYAYSTWTKDSWKDMDPRPSATASFATGSTSSTTSILDLDGRARKANGAKGAWELYKLDTPTGLTAAILSATSINVYWTAVPNAEYYVVTAGGVTNTVTDTSCIVSGLVEGTTYAIQVVAYAPDAHYLPSDAATASATTPEDERTKIASPGFRDSRINADELWFEWKMIPNGGAYMQVTIYDTTVADANIIYQHTYDFQTNEYTHTPVVPNKTYIVGLRALPIEDSEKWSASDETTASFVYSAATQLAAPTVQTFIRPSSDSLKLSYLQVRLSAEVANATSYEYQIATNSAFTAGLLTRTSSTVTSGYPLSGYFTGLTSGTLYYARARALSSNSDYATSNWSNVKSTHVTSYLATPVVTVSNITTTSATLSWGAVANRSSYTVRWRVSGASTWNSATGLTTTSRSLSGLTTGATYEYEVTAIGDDDEYLNSTAATGTFTTTSTQTLPTPTNLAVSNITTTTATLSWGAVTNASGYIVEWRVSGASSWNNQEVNA